MILYIRSAGKEDLEWGAPIRAGSRTDSVGAAQNMRARKGVWSRDLLKPRGGEGWQAVHRKEL